MRQILLYVAIMFCGAIIARKNLIPQFLKKRLGIFQTMSLFIILGTMGYKIGINDNILANFKIIGGQAVIFAICTAGGSILFTYFCFMGIKALSTKNINVSEKRGGQE